jgi:hypothetical protein
MESDASDAVTADRKSPEDLARLLVLLFGEGFGGASSGKFRVSRKFLRKLAGRRKLPDAYLAALAEEIFEAGFVFVDCESYAIVLSQKQFVSHRRVTSAAANKVLSHAEKNTDSKPTRDKESVRTDIARIEKRSVQKAPKIH